MIVSSLGGVCVRWVLIARPAALIGNFYGLKQFRKKFGHPIGNDDYQISSIWMSGLQIGAQIGQICGLMVAGWIADHIGYRKTLLAAQFLMIGFIFLFLIAQNIGKRHHLRE